MTTKQSAKVFLAGATGAVGKEVAKELLTHPNPPFSAVHVLTRKPLSEVIPDIKLTPNYALLHEHILKDFDTIETWAKSFAELPSISHVFWCLGSTRAQAGSAEAFRKIDYGYTMSFAKEFASQTKDKDVHYLLVSASNANKDSWFLYPKTKGETEHDLSQLGIKKLSIFRPGLLLPESPRPDKRLGEGFAMKLAPMMEYLAPGKLSVKCSTVAKAMVKVAFDNEIQKRGRDGVVGNAKVWGNSEIVNVGEAASKI